jgi:uracil-DNA glycosylase
MLNKCLTCDLPCSDVNKDFIVPKVDIQQSQVRLALISEAPPLDPSDYYYRRVSGSFFKTTQAAFRDAGLSMDSYDDFSRKGIYLTTAIKCSKKGYLVKTDTLKHCSGLLEKELGQFTNLKVVMCMGDFAIKVANYISKRQHGVAAIPSGSTYKIRQGKYELGGVRYFPSYTQTGAGYDIEKVKRKMIAEDIEKAVAIIE